jgi:tRNA1Val (adenine37-N6)-methyltransferase
MAFHFLQFTVEDRQSTLRIGTDAMLLGSWANPGTSAKILDIGTGCGVLALMMAQKSEGVIEAIDIDPASVIEAGSNFSNSRWASRMTAILDSAQSFACKAQAGFGFIISNPPYFSNSLRSLSARNNQARHDDTLSLNELGHAVTLLLTGEGTFAMILPTGSAQTAENIFEEKGLFLTRQMVVYPKPGGRAKRTLMEFTKMKITNPENGVLTIRNGEGRYTPEYLQLTKHFHNFLF